MEVESGLLEEHFPLQTGSFHFHVSSRFYIRRYELKSFWNVLVGSSVGPLGAGSGVSHGEEKTGGSFSI